jgi:hypothetical protein
VGGRRAKKGIQREQDEELIYREKVEVVRLCQRITLFHLCRKSRKIKWLIYMYAAPHRRTSQTYTNVSYNGIFMNLIKRNPFLLVFDAIESLHRSAFCVLVG